MGQFTINQMHDLGVLVDDIANGDYMTSAQAAAALGLQQGTIRKAYRDGFLKGRAFMQGGWRILFITPESVEDYRLQHLGRRGRRRKTEPLSEA